MNFLKLTLLIPLLFLQFEGVAQSPSLEDSWDLARSRYEQKDFASFFAIAQWVRVRFKSQMNQDQRDQWVALELMGLSHHCSWQDIQNLISSIQPLGPLASEAIKYIEMKSGYESFKNDPSSNDLSMTEKFEKRRSQWKISYPQFLKVKDPQNLRVEVRSRCE